MAYVFTKNLTPTSGAVAVFNLKQALKASGWTVLKSSDGSTYNASGDQLTAGNTVVGGLQNIKAWFVIQQPAASFGAQRQFCFQCGTTTGDTWRVKYSLAGFAGGSPGSVQVPSATDEVFIQGGGTDAAPTFTFMCRAPFGTTQPIRQQIMVNDAPPHEFYALSHPQGGGDAKQLLMLDVMVTNTFDVLDVDPHVLLFGSGQNIVANDMFGWQQFYGASLDAKTWFKKGMAGALFTPIAANQYAFGNYSGAVGYYSFTLGLNPYSGKDILLPLMFARTTNEATAIGLKGQSTLMRWNSSARATGDTVSTVSTRDGFCALGPTPNCVVFPWDGSVPLV